MIRRRVTWWRWLGSLAFAACVAAPGARAVPSDANPETDARPYVEPAPVRVYRFHVYSTMKSRWKKTVLIDSLVSTSQKGVVEGDRGLLERKLDAASLDSEWATVAKVVVKKVLPKGRLQVEIESEETEARVKRGGKLPYAPGQKVRLQIDRVMSAP